MTDSTFLWLDSVIRIGEPAVAKFCDCLMQLRAYVGAHAGDPTGFHYPPALTGWRLLTTPFFVHAKPGCRVWNLPIDTNIEQDLERTPPMQTLTDGREMKVTETVLPFATEPAWFVVWTTASHKQVVLATETDAQQ